MVAQLTGLACNAGLAYVLTLGRFGFPALGVTGAALATVTSQGIIAALLFARFLRPEFRRECHTANSRGWDWRLMKTLMQFGLPNGFRFAVEVFGWTLFLFFIGRIGTVELAASTIAFRINGLAFFPLFGLAEAVRTLVGHAQGQLDHRRAARVTWHGLLVAEGWMLATAPLFLIFPHQCYALFRAEPGVVDTGVVLLRFVAAYCVLDAANVIIVGALQAAGDTRWTLRAVLVLYAGFFAGLAGADYWRLGLYVEWLVATVFVILLALVWLLRFRGGAWRHIRVIEPDPVLVAG
jgi:MATE family multidrug resistance protein